MSSNADKVREAREELHRAIGQPSMEELLSMESEGWNPEVGETLTGTVLTVGRCDCGGFGMHPLIEIQSDDGKIVAVHGFHEVLRNAIERNNPHAGEYVGIKYFGKLEGRGSFEGYENYRLIVQR